MPTLASDFSFTIASGAQSVDPAVTRNITVSSPSHEKTVTVAGASSQTFTTLWDSSVDALTTFTAGWFIADPQGLRASAQDVDLRLTVNSVTHLRRVNTNFPLFTFGPSAQATGAVTKIEVANKAGTTVTTDDVDGVIRLFK